MMRFNPITPVVRPAPAQRLGGAPRFGYMDASQEARVFALLPPEAKVTALINRYEELSRTPFGFEPASKRQAREQSLPGVEKDLQAAIAHKGFTQAHAVELLANLYAKRDGLAHQLPKPIFEALYQKATTKPPEPARPKADIPEPLLKRMNNGGQVLRVSPDELEALLAAAGQG